MAIKFTDVADATKTQAPRKQKMDPGTDRAAAFNRGEYQREYMRASRTSVCYVYIIGVGKSPLKIGVTIDIGKRLEALTASSPYPLTVFSLWKTENRAKADIIEFAAHLKLSQYHSHHEWFACDMDVAIAAVKEAGASEAVDLTTIKWVPEKRKPWERRKTPIEVAGRLPPMARDADK